MKPRGGRTADRPAGHDALAGHNRLDLLPQEKVYRGFVDITLLYFNDCPNWGQAAKNLDALAAEFPDLNVNAGSSTPTQRRCGSGSTDHPAS